MNAALHPRFVLSSPSTIDAATQWLERWLRLKARHTCNPAAVFDIDQTLFSRGSGPIGPVRDLFYACERLGIERFLVTARREIGRQYTLAELKTFGIVRFGGSSHLFMTPESVPLASSGRESRRNIGLSKKRARDKIERRGFTIVCNAGDAWTDHFALSELPDEFRANEETLALFVDPQSGCAHLKLLA